MVPKVLVVESNDLFRATIAQHLERGKCRVYQAAIQAAAEEILNKKDCDVVLIGLSGFGREGLKLLEAVKTIRPLTEVILIAGHEPISLSIEGMKLGAFDDVRVPLDIESLLHKVNKACSRKRENSKANRRSLGQRLQDILVAASFAEAGEFDVAEKMARKDKDRS